MNTKLRLNSRNFYNDTRLLLLVTFTFSLSHLTLAFFNADELKFINYEIDILSLPVKRGHEIELPVLHMTSKFGQQYQCQLPVPEVKDENKDGNQSGDATIPDIKDLLSPLKTLPCLLKTKDWWTYEFCYGSHIKQYHIEDGQVSSAVMTLGQYDSDYSWENKEDKTETSKLEQNRFHSQFYVNGSVCDLTSQSRSSEVRFFCEPDAGDFIYRVDEPETCRYIITIHTARLCKHPHLKPLPTYRPQSITCNPILEEEQYNKYLVRMEEEKQQEEEKRQTWIVEQQERLHNLKQWLQKQREQVEETHKSEPATETEKDADEKINIEVIEDDDSEMLEEFSKEIKEMTPAERDTYIRRKSELHDKITKEFDAILDEAEEELNKELDKSTRDVAFTKLASSLNKLLLKLDKAEKDVAEVTEELETAKKVVNILEEEADGSKETKSPDSISNKIRGDASLKEIFLEKEDEIDDAELHEKDEQEEPDVERKGKIASVPDDGKVRVRIRRLDPEAQKNDGKLTWMRQREIDSDQKEKLEKAVKEKLEQAGLDTSGRKIEVKIITAGYYDNEEGKDFQIFSDEDTQQFQSMIMTLLAGNQEARKEIERQQRIEKNYQFVWGNQEPDRTKDEED